MSCEKTQLLLSKYADNEATQAEREAVRAHIAGCASCAHKLAEFEQVPAIFASLTARPPEPQLRVGVFREINLMKEEERRKQHDAQEKRPWYLPISPLRVDGRSRSALARLWTAFMPITVGMVTVLALFGVMIYINKPASIQKANAPTKIAYMPPVPTAPAPAPIANLTRGMAQNSGSPNPPAAGTKGIPAVYSPIPLEDSATVLPTSVREGFVLLSDPTPVLEDLDSSGKPIHMVRDPMYGYSVYFPSNWWTQTEGSVRYIRPWLTDGGDSNPYWVEVHVASNAQSYTADSYNKAHLNNAGTLLPGTGKDDMRLDYISYDSENSYHDLYSFDAQHIYTLRLTVPNNGQFPGYADYSKRWLDAEAIFSLMSTRTDFTQATSSASAPAADNRSVLFLNGPDLYQVRMNGQARAVTNGGFNVRRFALSPDMRKVAFTSTRQQAEYWGSELYLTDLESEASDAIQPLWIDTIEIHDIAWYSDRVLLALAKTSDGNGLYRISLPQEGQRFNPAIMIQLITSLGEDMAGANGLLVSPDRQLISFLAPIGESLGTDIYAVRPDGSDLQILVSHSLPISPSATDTPILAPENQAIKSYVWLDGRLESGGYEFSFLFTCGNSLSPSLDRGGFLYTIPAENHKSSLGSTVLDHMGVVDPTKLQIVHMAYSTDGKLAMTGYYNDYQEGRADKLAGLWTADIVNGQVVNVRPQPLPQPPDGITDLQWSPDNSSLVYRETIPQDPDSLSARYDGHSPFMIIKLDVNTGSRTMLYGGGLR